MSSKFLERRTPPLTKKQILLDLFFQNEAGAFFNSGPDEELGFPRHQFDLPAADWKALGSPEVITLTIEPGDLLNGFPSANHVAYDA